MYDKDDKGKEKKQMENRDGKTLSLATEWKGGRQIKIVERILRAWCVALNRVHVQ